MTENILSELSDIQHGDNININFENAITLAERLDFLDVQLLRKFYMNGREETFALQSYCLPILFNEMKVAQKMKIKLNAFRYRINNLVKLGLLTRVLRSNPAIYLPLRNKEMFVKTVVTKFFVLNGLLKFL